MTNITTPRVKGGRRAARICLVLALCLCFFAAAVCPVSAASVYPAATDYIADDAAILSESTVREIKEKYKLDARVLRNLILIYDRPENATDAKPNFD